MKRDSRLGGLSSEHHAALVLARTLARRVADGDSTLETARWLEGRFARELEPHFRIEEELLLPALREAGEVDLAVRTANDHAFLRERIRAALTAENEALSAFATLLEEHVRFEERELFPRCEAVLPGAVLDEVFRRCPHASG